MFVREQPGRPGVGLDRIKERGGDSARQQPVAILGKRRGMPDRVIHIQPDEPPEQQVVGELFHEQPLAPHRVNLQQQSAQPFDGRPVVAYRSNGHCLQGFVRQRPNGPSAGTRCSGDR